MRYIIMPLIEQTAKLKSANLKKKDYSELSLPLGLGKASDYYIVDVALFQNNMTV